MFIFLDLVGVGHLKVHAVYIYIYIASLLLASAGCCIDWVIECLMTLLLNFFSPLTGYPILTSAECWHRVPRLLVFLWRQKGNSVFVLYLFI